MSERVYTPHGVAGAVCGREGDDPSVGAILEDVVGSPFSLLAGTRSRRSKEP
jgi:hypothetical protein